MICCCRAQHVACRDVAHAIATHKPTALGAFSYARWPEYDQVVLLPLRAGEQ